ncbi:Primosomal protein N' [Delftia tsuruhatensis]|uniref:replication restart helicase PriA n=1 Tax=Delftia tsuruhatensis TaxID=180282 RepID=UPI001E764B4A|nr:primosomal protein N' [Delftia tsuruhatensis]CAB5698427.1 Primosomal protein N' [Delftia tsuruhatensis]CAC9676426.1 Primosomal protein N' [Delftia tsuruhatensis]
MSLPAHTVHVAVQTPAHSAVGELLSYASAQPLAPGTLVRVPLGRRELLGVVWDTPALPPDMPEGLELRPVSAVLDGIAPLAPAWRRLVAFAAYYYQRSVGEIAVTALPPQLRDMTAEQLARRLRPPKAATKSRASSRKAAQASAPDAGQVQAPSAPVPDTAPIALSAEQADVFAQIAAHPGPFLLHGSTGSGKTEVYLRAAQAALEADPGAQVLVMVPEINLTPQLEQRFTARFAPRYGASCVASMHSGMTNPQRLKSWLAAHTGTARIVLGTRMSVFASLPGLSLVVVDEEHDASYKQQEGARYSARDLAIWRARDCGAKVILGSATPSLESWHASRPPSPEEPQGGRYLRLHMPSRIGAAALPRVHLVDMGQQPRKAVFSPPLIEAITERVRRGEQSLVLLNRRGFAPVLFCADCGWKSDCPHCSAHQVFHKADRTLRCHHCGFTQRVPRACPGCGNPDILPLGKGTEQLEEELARLLRNVQRPDREPARVARIDADTTRAKGALEQQLAQVHAGDIDVLVGTQMVAKGHDFRRITLVAAVQPDSALFSSDYRAPERLFSLLMQAAGRAGRDAQYVAAQASHPQMWIQTHDPSHPVYTALRSHDYPAFAARQLRERRDAGMPPFAFQAIVRADARSQQEAQAFLLAATEAAREAGLPHMDEVFLYPPIPMAVQRVANVERAQMLIESARRPALLRFLCAWQGHLHWIRAQPAHRALVRWLVDVDPLSI